MLNNLPQNPDTSAPLPVSSRIILLFIILVSIAIRLYGLDFGLPQTFHPDEPVVVTRAQYGVATGDWNPRAFAWPSLQIYLLGLEYEIWHQLGNFTGAEWNGPEYADFIPPDRFAAYALRFPGGFYYLGRLTTLLFGVGVVWLMFILARRFLTIYGALAATALVALNPIMIRHSRYITPDIPSELFFIAALIFMDRLNRILNFPRLKNENSNSNPHADPIMPAILSALFIGLGTGTKYPVAVLSVPLIGLILFSPSGKNIAWRISMSIRAGLVILIAFLLTTPYALLDWPKFLLDIRMMEHHVQSGHIGMEARGGIWLASLRKLALDCGWLWLLSGAAGLLYFFRNIRRTIPFIIAFIFVLVGLAPLDVFSDRYLIPLVPFWAMGIASLIDIIPNLKNFNKTNTAALSILSVIIVTAVTADGLMAAWKDTRELTLPDTRELALAWVDENIPARSVIVGEQGGPDIPGVDPSDPDADNFARLLGDHWYYVKEITPLFSRGGDFSDPLDTLIQTTPEWVITSGNVRDRYMREGAEEEFPELVAVFREYYRLVDNYLIEEARFTPGNGVVGSEIAIYSVPQGFWNRVVLDTTTVGQVLGNGN